MQHGVDQLQAEFLEAPDLEISMQDLMEHRMQASGIHQR
jgi:hypothetical protein